MDSIKRKGDDAVTNGGDKKPKKEACPHAEKCYRRNPHHFKEYAHQHLDEFLEEGGDLVFPASFTQDRRIYVEQLQVLRSLMHINIKPFKSEVKKSPVSRSIDANSAAAWMFKQVSLDSRRNGPGYKAIWDEAASSSNNASVNKEELTTTGTSLSSKTPVNKGKLDTTASSSSKTTVNKGKTVKTTIYKPNFDSPVTTGRKGDLKMIDKLEACAPYNIFFTKVPKAVKTSGPHNCISFPDLICPSLGELKCSMQINFMIDVMWLNEQYQVHNQHKKPLTILYGYEFPDMQKYMNLKLKNVSHYLVNMKDPFGTHHSKVGVYAYENGDIRIVVSTANLYYEDWNHYNQGLWVSPPCPRMDDSKQDFECSGPTGFKTVLIKYLNSYNAPILTDWINLVKRADFSNVKVCLITSVPGKHYPKDTGCHLQQIGSLLSSHCTLPSKTTPQSEGPLSWGVIAQASSIGSLGKTPADWLRRYLLRSLASHKQQPLPNTSNASLSVVFPSAANVMNSHFGAEGGGCLPYSKTVNDKQKWLQDYLHQWKADDLGRSRAMPHMKSYCRVSPCLTKLAWFLLTSSNLSKSAWGGNIQKDQGCYVRSYEVGVLFLPSFFEEEYFTISRESGDVKLFPFMYDLPLTPYSKGDEPWCN